LLVLPFWENNSSGIYPMLLRASIVTFPNTN
jgi:hypothetical protein